jgi:HK97 gp10 family phage protein
MTEALDLGPLDASLADLERAVSGEAMARPLASAGEAIADAWRSNIESAGEVDTGAYLGSIRVQPIDADDGQAAAAVYTDLADNYPAILEFGTSEISARPVAQQAFDEHQAEVADRVADELRDRIRGVSR